jgi:hypothetical protein
LQQKNSEQERLSRRIPATSLVSACEITAKLFADNPLLFAATRFNNEQWSKLRSATNCREVPPIMGLRRISGQRAHDCPAGHHFRSRQAAAFARVMRSLT